jgi:hypothetical protein
MWDRRPFRASPPSPCSTATRHPQDRLADIEGKDEYVAALEARAVEWANRAARRGG